MSIKLKITAIVISCILVLSALAGGITAIVLNEINKGKALQDTASNVTTLSQNIYNTTTGSDGKLTVNSAAVAELLNAINYNSYTASDTGFKAHDIATRTGGTSGNTIKFPMGYFVNASGNLDTSKPLYWQVVYLRNGYLTIWLDKSYTVSLFNSNQTGSGTGGGYINSNTSPFIVSQYTTRPSNYGYLSNYSYSTLRDVADRIFTLLDGKLSGFSGTNGLIQPPSVASESWQATQTEDVHTYSSTYYDHHNGLESYGGSYTGWGTGTGSSWRSCMDDEFWIPSSVEVFNQSASGQSVDNGLWGLTADDRGYGDGANSSSTSNTSYCYDGSVYNSSSYVYPYSCWLRSGNSNSNNYAMLVLSSGTAVSGFMNLSRGVRPAAHISLSALSNQLPKTITTAVTPAGSGTASGGQTNITPNTEITLTATANAGYSFVGWSLDGGNTLIPESIGKSEYTITVTQDATYTAVFEGGITITSANPSTEFNVLRESNDGVTHSYLIQTIGTNYLDRIAVIGTTTPNEEDYNKVSAIDGYISGQEYCTAVHYITNTTGNSFVLEVYNATSPFVIYLDFTDIAQNFKASGNLNGVAVSVAYQNADGTISTGNTTADGTPLYAIGEARIQGYTTTENLTEVIVIAKAYTDYEFKGWMIDGEFISYTDENSNEITLTGTTHLSARIPFEIVNGKQIFAVFGAVDSSHQNDDTNTDNDFA